MPVDGARAGRAHPAVPRLAIIVVAAAGLLAGCGSAASHTPSKRELALQRAQLVLVSKGLRAAEGSVQQEVAASRSAWPLIADGLPQTPSGSLRRAVGNASVRAKRLPEPPFMAKASELSGPAAGLAGLYEGFSRLAERGWRLIESSIDAIASGSPSIAGFERANSSLYIDAVYDSHFDLALVGKSLTEAYRQLGGAQAFGAALTQSEVNALAAAYSIPAVRLAPHPGDTGEAG
jgi:hypothetical protein